MLREGRVVAAGPLPHVMNDQQLSETFGMRLQLDEHDGRIDVSRNTYLNFEGRYLISTDHPGSPNIQADLARPPIAQTFGATAGLGQRFNRLDVTAKATADRTW